MEGLGVKSAYCTLSLLGVKSAYCTLSLLRPRGAEGARGGPRGPYGEGGASPFNLALIDQALLYSLLWPSSAPSQTTTEGGEGVP